MVTTTHNNLGYDVLGVERGIGLDDIMPDMKPRQLKQKSKPEAAGNGREEREAQTFRQYFKYDHLKNLRICNVHLGNNHPTGISLFLAALRQTLAE